MLNPKGRFLGQPKTSVTPHDLKNDKKLINWETFIKLKKNVRKFLKVWFLKVFCYFKIFFKPAIAVFRYQMTFVPRVYFRPGVLNRENFPQKNLYFIFHHISYLILQKKSICFIKKLQKNIIIIKKFYYIFNNSKFAILWNERKKNLGNSDYFFCYQYHMKNFHKK